MRAAIPPHRVRAAMIEVLESRTMLSAEPILLESFPSPARSGNWSTPVAVGEKLFFAARGQLDGVSLCWTDGTSSGTECQGQLSTNEWFTKVGETLVFVGSGDRELWKSDGTVAGTVRVSSVYGNQGKLGRIVDANGVAYFPVQKSGGLGWELWKSDGTDSGTVRITTISSTNQEPINYLTSIDGLVYFTGGVGADYGLWRSDGTEAGTFRVLTGTRIYIEIVAAGNDLYFVGGLNGYEAVYRFDRTTYEVTLVLDRLYGPNGFTVVGQDLYFRAIRNVSPYEFWPLWVSNKSDGTARLANSRDGNIIAVVGDTLFYVGSPGYENTAIRELRKTSGVLSASEVIVSNSNRYSSSFASYGDQFFFVSDDGISGLEIWRSDGTPQGTVRVTDLVPGAGSLWPFYPGVINDKLVFASLHTTPSSLDLWSIDLDTRVAGDVNGDGRVGVDDVVLLQSHWGNEASATCANCDLNGDNLIDQKDVALLVSNFGYSDVPAAPSSIVVHSGGPSPLKVTRRVSASSTRLREMTTSLGTSSAAGSGVGTLKAQRTRGNMQRALVDLSFADW